jgi:tetratricopeptide (TPR) repeat protein
VSSIGHVPSLATQAELRELAERRHRDPTQAMAQARELMASDDPVVVATAEWIVGLALHELGRPAEAVTIYRSSIDDCDKASDPAIEEIRALATAGLAIALLAVGEGNDANREMARARRQAPGPVQPVVEMLYGYLLSRTGRLNDAMSTYRRAERALQRADDRPSLARLYLNRGPLRVYRGDLDGAVADLDAAERMATAENLPALAAMAAHNTGFAEGRRGNLPTALEACDRAEAAYRRLENPDLGLAVLQADRCEIYLLAGLVAEARTAATAAVTGIQALGEQSQLGESRLLLARALLAGHAYEEAAAEATDVARHFETAKRRPWAAQARYLAMQAEILASQDAAPPPELLGRSRQLATELDRHGWRIEAVHVRTFVGRLALGLGRPAVARAELADAAAARRRGPAELRAQAWHAAALLSLAEGDRAGARRALTHGLGVVDRYRASLGATELRTGAAGHGAELARLGTRLALDDGRPAEVLRWAERWRAGALRRPAVRPPDDALVATELAELRAVDTEIREAALSGAVPPALTRRAAVLEETVRRLTRRARDEGAAQSGRVDVGEVRRAVGPRVLVEYVELDGELRAVTVHRGRLRVHELGPMAEIERERDYLLFSLRRLLTGYATAQHQDTVDATAQRLDALLLAPLHIADGVEVVIVPTGGLHGVAWSALPTIAGRTTTVAPSATIWLGAYGPAGPRRAKPRTAIVAGPDLPGADDEVRQLRKLYPGAETLSGTEATAERVVAALERADLAHLAAHGRFRADSPLFSSIRLFDGPLTIYDLERLRRAPSTVVLSACDAGAVAVRTGDELLGTAAAMIGLGVRWVIAPVMAVPDEATTPFMLALHEGLRHGDTPPTALAEAAAVRPGVAAATFVCVGCDDASFSER